MRYGGTVISIFAAASNFGKTWPGTAALLLNTLLDDETLPHNVTAATTNGLNEAQWHAYTSVCLVSTFAGCIWLLVCTKPILQFGRKTAADFACAPTRKTDVLLT